MAEKREYRTRSGGSGRRNGDSDLLLCCSLSGRIVHATAELKLKLGTELAGRNLNDFLDDKTVSDIIAKSASGDYCRFSCLLTGQKYSAVSEKEGSVITVTFYEEDNGSIGTVGENSLKYLQSEINELLSNLLGALKNIGGEDNPTTMFAKKNIYRLLRASRNVFDRAACEDGTISGEKSVHDVLEICTDVVEKLRFPLRTVNTELEIWHDGERHICTCVAEHVERMLSNIISCALKGKISQTGSTYLKIEIISKENDVLVSVLSEKRILSEKMLVNVFGMDEDGRGIDREIMQSLLTVKALAAYNGGNFIMAAEKDCDRLAFLLPKAPADKAFRFKSPGVKYMTGTNTALVELAEILPDSLY